MLFHEDIPGFPEEIGTHIDLPDIAELLVMPMFNNVSVEDLRKYGTDFHRELIDKTPLRNNTMYVAVKSFVQFLHPGIGACDIKVHPRFQNEWHIDLDPKGGNYAWHILTSPCTSRTEFNINPFPLLLEDFSTMRFYLNEKEEQLNLVGQKIEPNKFCTFTNHVHRPAPPEKPEFRFFFRVQETDFLEPVPIEQAFMQSNQKNGFRGTMVHRNGRNIPNLEHIPKGIFIHYPWNEVQ